MSLIDEMRLLAEDVTQLFVRIYRVMHSFPLFMDLKFGANNELKNDSTLFNNIHNDSRYNNDEIIANYLSCRGMFSSINRCLERLACHYGDQQNGRLRPLERDVAAL